MVPVMGNRSYNTRFKATRRLRRVWSFSLAVIALPIGAFSASFCAPSEPEIVEDGASKAYPAIGVAGPMDREEAYFPICSGPVRTTCVVDGDTIWYEGEKIRLVGFDTPETWKPKCPNERQLGEQATRRLQALLNAAAFSLEPHPEGELYDRYGRALFVVSRGGTNLGDVLVAEGLAERRGGWSNAWC